MSSLGHGNWTFHTPRYRVEYNTYAEGKIRMAIIYRKANDAIPIGSASSFYYPKMNKQELLRHALKRAEDNIIVGFLCRTGLVAW